MKVFSKHRYCLSNFFLFAFTMVTWFMVSCTYGGTHMITPEPTVYLCCSLLLLLFIIVYTALFVLSKGKKLYEVLLFLALFFIAGASALLFLVGAGVSELGKDFSFG